MRELLIILLLTITLSGAITSCAESASDREIEKMCLHLAKLRGEEQDKSELKKCIKEAKKEGVSKRQALCRISAVNVTEYWVRCRTGEARTKKTN